MGRLDPAFSEEHRLAVIGAVLEGGATAKEAAGLAAEGELGLDPFTVAASTVQHWVDQHRCTEGVEEGGREEADAARAIAQETIRSIREIPPAERTAKQMTALESALRVVKRSDRVAPRRPPPKEPKRDENGRTRLEALIASMEEPDKPHEPSLGEIRHELSKRWVRAQVALEKPKGGAGYQRCPGRPWAFEEQWREAGNDEERRAVLERERLELEALEAVGGNGAAA
jgi:transposase-like protein